MPCLSQRPSPGAQQVRPTIVSAPLVVLQLLPFLPWGGSQECSMPLQVVLLLLELETGKSKSLIRWKRLKGGKRREKAEKANLIYNYTFGKQSTSLVEMS